MMGRAGWVVALALGSSTLWAQNEMDVLRYSQQDISGTLRNLGMGGTVAAVGADLSCAFSNPAGLGMYRRGDVGFDWGFAGAQTGLSFGELSQRGNAGNAPVTNAGLAITYPSINPDWPFVTLAIAYQKRTELHQQIIAEGALLDGSLLDLFHDQAQGLFVSEMESQMAFTSALAWNAYLLDPDPANPSCETCYVSAMDGSGGALAKRRIDRTGTVGETAVSFAANHRNRLYLGGTLGLPRVSFTEQSLHEEVPRVDSVALTGWSFSERLDVEGSGVNVRAGVIWAATDWMRLGVNYATRSRLALRDGYASEIASHWNDGTSNDAASPLNQFEYIIYTPARLAVNAAFVLGKFGLVAAEYERTDYRSGVLRPAAFSGPSAYEFESENATIATIHTVSHAARAGAEFRIAQDHRIRIGAGMAPSPYNDAANVETDATRYHGSLGWAYRGETWYAGTSYVMTVWSEDLRLWGPQDLSNPATLTRRNGLFTIGVGARL